jgi:hypothetical protein
MRAKPETHLRTSGVTEGVQTGKLLEEQTGERPAMITA